MFSIEMFSIEIVSTLTSYDEINCVKFINRKLTSIKKHEHL